jgi:hypothetical protein
MSAFNTRMDKNPNMFVRTHFVYYFASLLLVDILQGGFSVLGTHFSHVHLPCQPQAVSFRAVVGCSSPILLLTYILAAIGGLITSTWIRDQAVIFGSLCTAQGNCVQEYPCRTPSLILSPSRCDQTFGGCWYCHLVSATFLCEGQLFITLLYQVFGMVLTWAPAQLLFIQPFDRLLRRIHSPSSSFASQSSETSHGSL